MDTEAVLCLSLALLLVNRAKADRFQTGVGSCDDDTHWLITGRPLPGKTTEEVRKKKKKKKDLGAGTSQSVTSV